MMLQRVLDYLDSWLDKLTTYRLVLYSLYVYIASACLLSLSGQVSFPATHILASAAFLVAVCRAVNWSVSRLFKLPRNHESDLITALILALIMSPATDLSSYGVLAAAGATAMLSKYIIVIHRKHLLNPAALGAFLAGGLFHQYASWWVGSISMAPLLIIGGLLILRKLRRFQMAGAFIFISLAYIIAAAHPGQVGHNVWFALASTPLLFFATVMLTEPLTSPTQLQKELIYGGFIGLLYSVSRLGLSPEEALLIGNLLAFAMTPVRSHRLEFVGLRQEAHSIYSFIFRASPKLKFQPGQYMEWTLPGVAADSRGNRRYLTIASSPTEPDVMLTVKVPPKPSSFKRSLLSLKPGQPIYAAQLTGDFTLRGGSDQKLAFLAGGVGITPFRSMIKYLLDSGQKADATLIYSVSPSSEAAYRQLLNQAGQAGLKHHLTGHLNAKTLKELVPDYNQRLFYISGPQAFVATLRQTLLRLGVKRRNIITDFFPGYG